MGGEHRFLGLLLSFSVAAGAWGSASRVEAADMADVAEGADAEVPGAWRSRVSAKLLSIYDTARAYKHTHPAPQPIGSACLLQTRQRRGRASTTKAGSRWTSTTIVDNCPR